MLLRSWNAGGEGSAAILLDWERNVLEAIFEGGAGRDLATTTDLDPDSDGQRRVGGPVNLRPGEPLTVRCTPLWGRTDLAYAHHRLQSWPAPASSC